MSYFSFQTTQKTKNKSETNIPEMSKPGRVFFSFHGGDGAEREGKKRRDSNQPLSSRATKQGLVICIRQDDYEPKRIAYQRGHQRLTGSLEGTFCLQVGTKTGPSY